MFFIHLIFLVFLIVMSRAWFVSCLILHGCKVVYLAGFSGLLFLIPVSDNSICIMLYLNCIVKRGFQSEEDDN